MTEERFQLKQKELKHLVAEPYFSRGEAYFQGGYIGLDSITLKKVKARALGTTLYHVTLKRTSKGLRADCTCPAFYDYGPCKHISATGLAIIKNRDGGYQPSPSFLEEIELYGRVEKNLMKHSKEELVQQIMQLIGDDPDMLFELDDE